MKQQIFAYKFIYRENQIQTEIYKNFGKYRKNRNKSNNSISVNKYIFRYAIVFRFIKFSVSLMNGE